jgi:hypothetical protein
MPNAKNPTSPEYQRLVAANPKYQAAFDRLLAAASSDKRRPRKDQTDSEIMVQSWFECWEQGGNFDTIALGIIPRWSDDDLADWEGISKDAITNAKRIEFARGWIDRTAEEHRALTL